MIDMLQRLFNLEKGEKVTYEQLETAEFGVWYSLRKDIKKKDISSETTGVWFKRYLTKASGQLMFITRIFKGSGWHYHYHDCKETITSMNGRYVINDKRIAENGEVVTFFSNTLHKVDYLDSDNDKYLEILVEFTKIK